MERGDDRPTQGRLTPYRIATRWGHHMVAQLLLEADAEKRIGRNGEDKSTQYLCVLPSQSVITWCNYRIVRLF
jgi:hypothetical protein